MSYNLNVIDETWGDHVPVGRKASVSNYADLKGYISDLVDCTVKDILQITDQLRVSTIAEVPKARYTVLVEWSPDGRLWQDGDTGATATDIGLQRAIVFYGLRDGL